MKAITLWQPWATLAALGLKHETRSWGTDYRGPIAIHAAAKKPDTRDIPASTVHRMIEVLRPITQKLAKTAMYLPLELLPRGCVVGIGNLVECYKILGVCGSACDEESPQGYLVTVEAAGRIRDILITHDDYLFGDWTPGRYAWALADAKMFQKPIPTRGKQRLWNWEATQAGEGERDG